MQMTGSMREPPVETPAAGEARNLLQSAIEWLPVGVLVVNGDGLIVIVNHQVERTFGYGHGELIGQSVDVLVPEGAGASDAAFRRDFTARPQPRAMAAGREVFGRRRDGSEVPIEIALTPIRISRSTLVLASVIDLTEYSRAQSALEEQPRFERVIGELGASVANVRPEDVNPALQHALDLVVRTLGLDIGVLFQVEDGGNFVPTLQAMRHGGAASSRVPALRDLPWHLSQIRAGALVSFASVEDVPDTIDRENLRCLGTKSGVALPLSFGGHTCGALSFHSAREARAWPPAVLAQLRVVALTFTNALARRFADEQVRRAVDSMTAFRDRLRDENQYLRGELQRLTGSHAIVGRSPAVRRTLEQVHQAASTESPVLLIGEPGTGKTLLAARIHDLSSRRERAMVRVHCAAVAALTEGRRLAAEQNPLAGDAARIGRLEIANGSTVLFDEIADLSLDAQADLISVLEDGEIRLPDHAGVVKVDVRIIAATRRHLKRCVAEGTFRDDLYFRLNAFPIHVPPLRDRRDDIPVLVWRFVDEFSVAFRRPIEAIDEESMTALQSYPWPGNARELRTVVEQAMLGSAARRLEIPTPSKATARRRKPFPAAASHV